MSTKKVETIPFETVVDIQISGAFYARIQNLLMHLSMQHPQEDFVKALERLKNAEPTNEFEYHLLTLLTLSQEIEAKAKLQNKLEMRDIPEPEDPAKV